MVEDALAQTRFLGVILKKLVIGQKLKALVKAHLSGRNEAQSLVRAGSTGVRQVLCAADVYCNVVGLRATPTIIPAYTFVPGVMNIAPRSCAFQMP